VSESERWERITSPKNESPALPEDETALREAWLSFASDVDRTAGAWAGPDPDDVWAAIERVERRRRQSYWLRGAAIAAGILLMIGAIGVSLWNPERPVFADKPMPVWLPEDIVWEDDWEQSAAECDLTLIAAIESMRPDPVEPWIDMRIQQLLEECVRVWLTL
jgi:hypothetical protein